MADRRIQGGNRPRRKVKRSAPSKTELKRRKLILETAKEVGRECALAVFSEGAERARLLITQEEQARLMQLGARLMLERLLEAGAFRYGLQEVVGHHLKNIGTGGYQVLRYGDYQIHPLDIDPSTL